MKPRLFLIALVFAVFVGGGIFLDTSTIPAPTHTIEKVIPNDRFFK